MEFHERLAELMSERGLSKLGLAREIGASDRVVGGWLKKEYVPALEKLCDLADYFGVSIDYLAGRSVERYEKENGGKRMDIKISDVQESGSGPVKNMEALEQIEDSQQKMMESMMPVYLERLSSLPERKRAVIFEVIDEVQRFRGDACYRVPLLVRSWLSLESPSREIVLGDACRRAEEEAAAKKEKTSPRSDGKVV